MMVFVWILAVLSYLAVGAGVAIALDDPQWASDPAARTGALTIIVIFWPFVAMAFITVRAFSP